MAIGLQDSRKAARRRRRRSVLKWILMIGIVVGLAVQGYRTGSTLAEREVTRLEAELDRTSARIAELEQTNATMQRALAEEKRKAERWESRYRQDVPTGTRKNLLALLDKRLEDGLSVERLTTVVRAARRERDCEGEPVTKRFIVSTPLTGGANESVSFADNAITVTAEGEASRNQAGAPEAWFDSARPVSVRFARLGGESSVASGVLPLHHSVVVDGWEFRFSVVKGEARGFVNVTGQRCRYP